MDGKKTVFSGIQPSGMPMLGNYIGAMRHFPELQEENNCLYCIVDLHAVTVRQDPELFRKKIMNLYMLYLAAGINPDKSILFIQSQVMEHAQLAWLLNCFTYVGELSRMTQFKDKARKHTENVNAGLFGYPVLMAADILLYQTSLVPVGDDQKQHLELSRDIAERFNKVYGRTFVVPDVYTPKTGARVMSLQEPHRKMDKSEKENLNNVVFLLDDPKTILSKVKKAVTDSEALVRYDPESKPGVSNLLDIYSALSGKAMTDAEKDFSGKGYGFFKEAVAETIIEALAPIQKRFAELERDPGYVTGLFAPSAERARALAAKTLASVQSKMGFI